MQNYQPIINALDSGNASLALKLVSSHQQLTPSLQILQAVALSRVNRIEEALLLAESLLKEASKFSYDQVDRLSLVFMSAQRFDLSARLHLNALSQQSNANNEQFSVQAFYCLVRARDYENQERHAMDMYKRFKETKYLLWHIASLLMNVKCGGSIAQQQDEKLKNLKFMIAERYLESALKEKITEWEKNQKSSNSFPECMFIAKIKSSFSDTQNY